VLGQLAKGLHKSQAKALVAAGAALVRTGQMRAFSIAQQLAASTGVRFKSAVQRFFRLMLNPKFDDWSCWSALAHRLLVAAGPRPLVAVDWTKWHSGLRVLTAAVCVGHRAIPSGANTCPKQAHVQSQNTVENAFLRKIATLSLLMEQTVLMFDRGFRWVSFIREANPRSHPPANSAPTRRPRHAGKRTWSTLRFVMAKSLLFAPRAFVRRGVFSCRWRRLIARPRSFPLRASHAQKLA
jgi:hypothetical protein